MDISKNLLEELESPTRIFRTNIDGCASPTKIKSFGFSLTNMFLRKREVLELDDLPEHAPRGQNFFTSELNCGKSDVGKIECSITKALAFKEDDRAKCGTDKFVPFVQLRYKPVRVSAVTQEKANARTEQDAPIDNDILSEDENFKKAINEAISTKADSLNASEVIGINNINDNNDIITKTDFNEKQQQLNNSTEIKRKRVKSNAAERVQLKSRAARIAAFWAGKNNFIPAAFRLLSMQVNPDKCIVELQDFSCKGLNHVEEGSYDEGLVPEARNGVKSSDTKISDGECVEEATNL